jgi:uncharacterized protein YbcI
VTVALSDATLVVTLHGALSEAEKALARTPEGAAKLQEYHRQLFAGASGSLCEEVARHTGVAVREATADIETTTGTAVLVFVLGGKVAECVWTERPAADGDD